MRVALPLVVAALVAWLAASPFARSLEYDFLAWDDDVNFAAPALRALDAESLRWMWSNFHVGHYAPLTWMSCAFDFARGGEAPARALHETNLALHGATAAALFGALYVLLGLCGVAWRAQLSAAALAALAWGVHPLRTESVAWLTERRDVLSGLFYALATWAWLLSVRPGACRWLWLSLSLTAFAAALLSKVSGVGLPLVFLALDAWPLKRLRETPRAALLEKLPYFALALGGAALGVLGQRESTQVLASAEQLGLAARVGLAAHSSAFYVLKTIAPSGLGPLYELPQSISLASLRFGAPLAALIASALLLIVTRKTSTARALAVGLFAYLVLLAPVSGLAHAGRQLAADRYSYLPSFALAGLFAAALIKWRGSVTNVVAGLAVVLLLSASTQQTSIWRNTTALFERAVELEPESYWANHKLGILYHQVSRFDDALERYGAALAARPTRDNAEAHYDRALTWLALSKFAEARADLEAALRAAPDQLGAHVVLNDLDRAERRPEAARARLARAFESAPSAELAVQRASLELELQQPAAALEWAQRIASAWPADVRGPKLAGMACLHLGRFAEAEKSLRAALSLERTPATLYNLAIALERQGRNADAREILNQLLELDPGNERARDKLRQL